MKRTFNRINSKKILWIIFGIGLIVYGYFILTQSPQLTYHAKPSQDLILKYVIQRILIGVLFFIAILNIRKITDNESWLTWIFILGIAVRILLIPSEPILEDDYNRYLWDGAVLVNGYNPFEYSPEEVIQESENLPGELIQLKNDAGVIAERINHPHIRTIYPMLAQVSFGAAYLISPFSISAWKVVLLFGDILIFIFLILILKHFKLPLIFSAVYWLNPVVIHEFFNAGHMDLFALLFVLLTIYFHLKNKNFTAIIMLALAVGFKVYPVLLLPVLLRNRLKEPKKLFSLLLIFIAAVFLIFLPVLLTELDLSLGFLKYAQKWANNAALYSLLKELLEWLNSLLGGFVHCVYCLARYVVVFAVLVWIFFLLKKKIGSDYNLVEIIFLILAFMYLISPTQFPWYYTWVVPLLVLQPRVSFLLYAVLLPLYQLKYLWEGYIYIQHLPVAILFTFEFLYRDKFDFLRTNLTIKKLLHRDFNN